MDDSSKSTVTETETHEESLIRRHWESYVNDLMASGNVSDAVIYELNTGKALGSSPSGFHLLQDEYEHIVNSFNKPLVFRRTGITLNGITYKTHVADGQRGIMGKTGLPAKGCTVCKTKALLIAAVHMETMNGKKCNDIVMNMGDFFWRKDM